MFLIIFLQDEKHKQLNNNFIKKYELQFIGFKHVRKKLHLATTLNDL